jgi:LysR family transcriptional regulator, cyn operon transcriptional activator
MDIRVLRYCETIARLGNITRAAAELHVAQPALSVAVRKLEEELGVTLFTRTRNKPVTLTSEGELLMKRAARLFHELDSARKELADARGLRTGKVRVGMPPMYGIGYFPSLMKAFHAAYPGINVTALEGSAGEIKSMLEEGRIDLAILEERRVQKGWAHATLDEEEVVLCVRADHPLAAKTCIADGDLDDLPMILFEGSFLQRNVLDQRCQKAGVKFRMVMQSNYVPMVYQAVVDGLGAATLLRSIVTADQRVMALSFEPQERFRFELCWLDEHYLSKANEAFMTFAVGHRKRAAGADPRE